MEGTADKSQQNTVPGKDNSQDTTPVDEDYGIYVHIPFCASKCYYCDFYSKRSSFPQDEYVRCLLSEYRARHEEMPGCAPATIYVGGGTPSLLELGQAELLMEGLPRMRAGGEATIEVNPEDVDLHKTLAWRDMGFNRVSMGVQSFIDAELEDVGRRHDSQDIYSAYHWITAAGIRNISLDLIYGLPGQTLRTWKKSVDQLMELSPTHFSAYMLMVERGTLLYARTLTGKFMEADENVLLEMYRYICNQAQRHGYIHYEISNWAKPGYESRHNSAYWDFKPYLGLGPSAHSFDGKVRRFNSGNLSSYADAISEGREFFQVEDESAQDIANDFIMVSLRRASGLDISQLSEKQAKEVMRNLKNIPRHLYSLENNGNIIRIPEEHMLMSDAVIRTLLLEGADN